MEIKAISIYILAFIFANRPVLLTNTKDIKINFTNLVAVGKKPDIPSLPKAVN